MKIIAHKHNKVFLIEIEHERGRVLNTRTNKLMPEFNIHSILARGYWEPYTGPQDILHDLLRHVQRAPDDDAPLPFEDYESM